MIRRFELFTITISQIYKNLQRIKLQEMTQYNLKGAHVMCLFELYLHPEGLTVTQLGRYCSEDKSAISRAVKDLSDKGYVSGDSKNKYRCPLLLTDEGRSIAMQINKRIDKAVAAGGDGLTDEERDVFYKVLEHISDNLDHYMTD